MSSPPSSKRMKTSLPPSQPARTGSQQQAATLAGSAPAPSFPLSAPTTHPLLPANSRKRRPSPLPAPLPPMDTNTIAPPAPTAPSSPDTPKKKGRTNTPWTAEEEQRLKAMRDAGKSWSEIAKTFPARTEGSVKKHWYKDMHYAEFAEDESIALREAIKEYEANKWKVIGQKVGKPAKACEQYAKEHFKNL